MGEANLHFGSASPPPSGWKASSSGKEELIVLEPRPRAVLGGTVVPAQCRCTSQKRSIPQCPFGTQELLPYSASSNRSADESERAANPGSGQVVTQGQYQHDA